jgi:hypothetical protein
MARPERRRSFVNVLYYGPPIAIAAIGIYRLYRATELNGEEAKEAFVLGLALITCAVLLVAVRCSRHRSWRDDLLETNQAGLSQRMERIEKEQEALRQDVHSRLAVQTWLETFDRVDGHTSKGWVHLNRPDP